MLRGRESELLSKLRQHIPDHYDMVDGEWINLAPDAKRRRASPSFSPPKVLTAYLSVRCRKCTECRQAKSRLWAARAFSELKVHQRTWFCTMTVAPAVRFVMASKVSSRIKESLTHMHATEQNRLLFQELSTEVTKWIKRIRKNSGARFRYLLAMEPHADGFPHVHALIHQVAGSVTQRDIRDAWNLGTITEAKLVDESDKRVPWYVCKYISKHSQTRVRASLRYGQVEDFIADRLSEAITAMQRATGTKRANEAGECLSPPLPAKAASEASGVSQKKGTAL